ncbi:hypothetical protein L227DRAFT_569901 [Lentinus tigrinus ALCF2SS1-6]|uniref:Uncharacterized protein n=2 Tax=Lentinus tigrinus TaxID=5365 RepID=A0A5C2SQ44_9APHY|nr:hypothetical protein L227DRAFT_569901 [Lentinus tigrinus ALCF2SS1-6]
MEPVAYKVLARKIAEDMEKYIDRERKARRPLTYRNVPLELGQLALCELHNISDGSWEPVFMIWTLPKIRRADRAERVPAI